MLSAETAVGKNPVRVVEMMSSIIREIEKENFGYFVDMGGDGILSVGAAVIDAGIKAAVSVDAKAIVCLTHTGATASLLARHRPKIPIVAITDQAEVLNRLSLVWGIESVLMEELIKDADELFKRAIKIVQETYQLKKGDKFVICCGFPSANKPKVNTMKICVIE